MKTKEAEEAIRKLILDEVAHGQGIDGEKFQVGLRDILKSLELVPADDEEAFDAAWLVSMGGEQEGRRIFFNRFYFYWVENKWATMYGNRAGVGLLTDAIQTKRQARAFLSVLNIPSPSKEE